MSENDNVFVFVATYGRVDDAQLDYQAVKDLHRQGLIGTYDAAVVEKGPDGKVHVHKTELPTRHGAAAGMVVGALLAVLFPPVFLIGGAIAGGLAGGLLGHFRGGLSRQDLKDLGQALDEGQAALVVIGESELAKKLEKVTARAQKRLEKQMQVDAKEFDKELERASQEAQ